MKSTILPLEDILALLTCGTWLSANTKGLDLDSLSKTMLKVVQMPRKQTNDIETQSPTSLIQYAHRRGPVPIHIYGSNHRSAQVQGL